MVQIVKDFKLNTTTNVTKYQPATMKHSTPAGKLFTRATMNNPLISPKIVCPFEFYQTVLTLVKCSLVKLKQLQHFFLLDGIRVLQSPHEKQYNPIQISTFQNGGGSVIVLDK